MATLIGVLVVVGIVVAWLVSVFSLRGVKRPRGDRGWRGTSQGDAGAGGWFGGWFGGDGGSSGGDCGGGWGGDGGGGGGGDGGGSC
jgi:hypothetical protein